MGQNHSGYSRIDRGEEPKSEPQIVFVSLGIVEIEEDQAGYRESTTDILSGAGVYGMIGARLFVSPNQSPSIGSIMRVGNNFPSSALKTMKTWETTLQRLEEPNHGLTNPVFEYGDTHFRSRFSKCLTRTLEVLPDHLVDTPHLLSSKVFHVVAGPVALKQQIARLLHLRKQAGLKGRPFILWEPANESCTQDNKQAFLEVMPQVDVISPTHFQLAIILGRKAPVFYDQVGIKGLSSEFIHLAVGKSCKGAIVLRAGRGGFFIKSGWIPTQHLPAFYQATQHHRSVDVTGEGSAFLGALAIGLLETGNLVEAAMYGVVATSFAGEQVGVPALSHAEDGRELWNNQSVRSRLAEYRAHVSLDD